MNGIKIEAVSVSWLIIFTHVGLKISLPNGTTVVYANAPGRGVVRQSLAEFNAGRCVTCTPINAADPYAVLARAEHALGTAYDLLSWNCEHFVNWALGVAPISPQLRAAGAGLLAGLLVTQLSDSKR